MYPALQKLAAWNRASHHRWLILIGILKLAKAAFFAAMGFGVIKLLHKDVADILMRAAIALKFDPENRAVNLILEKAALLSSHRLKLISIALLLYAVLDVVEGVGLILKKTWAEYLTLILTASFLPWEFYQIVRHVTALKVALTVTNVLVVAYLAYVVRDRIHEIDEYGHHR